MARRPVDEQFFERELAGFLPDKIFDAHIHMYEDGDYLSAPGLEHLGLAAYKEAVRDIHGDRTVGAMVLALGSPTVECSVEACNAFVAQEIAVDANFRGHFFVRPSDDPEWVRQEVKRLGLHGLKCYHTFADTTPTWEAEIPAYLPEVHVQVAHEEGWTITLHMVKRRGPADPGNQYWIRHYCETYPDMKLILAHSGRAFQPTHNLEGLPKLTGLDNLYFDTSANCEPIAHQAIMRIIGHDKLMYGTDLPISHARGRSVGSGDDFIWLCEDTPVWDESQAKIDPVLVGLEHARSVKWACWAERLDDNAVEDIFYNNAAKLFGLPA
jgi:glutamate-1-semialdehyde 2,1-aminomutase